jgi:ribosome-binding factor A
VLRDGRSEAEALTERRLQKVCMSVPRETRVGELLKNELADLVQNELSDPRVQSVVIARVDVTKDLRQAKVFFRLLSEDPSEGEQKRAHEGLTRASGFLRRECASRMQLRHAPELLFRYDASLEARLRIDGLLQEIADDRKKKPAP